MARDLSHDDAQQEDTLLIEAVSLLVQRQRETESWVAAQIERAEERTSAAERRYVELEDRLAGIEVQLDRLARDLEPGRGDAATGQRLARLREQVQDLRSDTDGRPLRSVPASVVREVEEPRAAVREVQPVDPPRPAPAREVVAEPARAAGASESVAEPPRTVVVTREVTAEPPRPVAAGASSGASANVWEMFGSTREDRFGLLLIFLGAVAVLYALLSQLRFG